MAPPVKHGAQSRATVGARVRYEKLSLLRPLGLRQADLSIAGRYWLSEWARVSAQVYLWDRWSDEHGWVGPDGNPPPWATHYYAARNAKSRLRTRLDPFLAEALGERRDPVDSLRRYLAGDES